MSIGKGLPNIRQESGVHFDPVMAAAFFDSGKKQQTEQLNSHKRFVKIL